MDRTRLQVASTRAREVLPERFLARLAQEFDESMQDRLLAATAIPGPRGVRLNPLREDPAATRDRLLADKFTFTDVPWSSDAIVVSREDVPRLLEHPWWKRGAFHIQALPSIAVSLVLAPQPGERILDLCAAPGGKTAHIAALMHNEGSIVATDRSRPRCHRMRALLKMLGASAHVRSADGSQLGYHEEMAYDRVLVDAPCSGEGRFTLESEKTYLDWTHKKTRRLASLQKALLHSAIHAVRPGGVVVYSTCTYGKAENEAVIERALKRYGEGPTGIELESFSETLPDEAGGMMRSIPDPSGDPVAQAMEGFFIAKLRRRER